MAAPSSRLDASQLVGNEEQATGSWMSQTRTKLGHKFWHGTPDDRLRPIAAAAALAQPRPRPGLAESLQLAHAPTPPAHMPPGITESGIPFPTTAPQPRIARRVVSETASEPSKRIQFLEPIKTDTLTQLRHSSVNPKEVAGDEDEWMMIDQDSFRLSPSEYRNRPLPPLPLEVRVRKAIERLKVEPMSPSKSPRKAVSRITEGISRRLAKECVTCMERIHGPEIRAPCGHYYDEECIDQLFSAAARDEALFPPACCGKRIPLATVREHLAPASLATFEEKRREFGAQKRVYCARGSCSRFLSVQYDSTRLTMNAPRLRCPAPGCGTVTCMRCKLEVQAGVHHRCDKDVDAVDALELGERAGWARCPGCETLIELNQGCFHMTCRCSTEFCYLCKKRWKTCHCPQWEESRLNGGGGGGDD